MIYEQLAVQGAYCVSIEPRGDDRGWFARAFCQQDFAEHGLDPRISQVNNSYSADKGTLRGFHMQIGGHEETKLVRCIAGAVFDVVLDLRPDSPTYLKADAREISAENRKLFYVPRGCGHAILTLQDDTELMYFASQHYSGGDERGVRWNDPIVAIDWPIEPTTISDKDASWPAYQA